MTRKIPPGLLEQARWQAGIVTREQALHAGLSNSAIRSKIVYNWWQKVHRGVYSIYTGPLTREARLWAAVLYAGAGARLSHQSAAELIRLTDRQSPLIHVTIPINRRVKAPSGVVIHASSCQRVDWRFARGIPPHTLAEETVIDLVQASADLDDAIACVTSAFGRGLTSKDRLTQEIAARSRMRWRAELGEIIAAAAGGAHSVAEYRYDRDVERAHGLPPAAKQVPFTKPDGRTGFRDRVYEEYGLIIELDGKQYHPDELKGRDQERDNHAAMTARATLRYGWVDVTRNRCESAAQVHTVLRRLGYGGPLIPCSPACGAPPLRSAERAAA